VLPEPSFSHLLHLTDSTGVFEHAHGTEPLRQHGYCSDDVARALVVVLREQSRTPELDELETIYLRFLERAQLPDGRFHNRLSAAPSPRWLDEVGSDDSIGRALRGLGAAVSHGRTSEVRSRALSCFEAGADFRSTSPRANAAAALGAADVLTVENGNIPAQRLLERASTRLRHVAEGPLRPWPEARLAYDNARLPEGRIAAGRALGDERLMEDGLGLLSWLVEAETIRGRFSFAPAPEGWAPGEPRPGYPQQPIEAGTMADACALAFDVTRDVYWAEVGVRAASWFLGANDLGLSLLDPMSGGCRDGLEASGCNENEGAESTLALISALQHARRLQAAARSAATTSEAATVAAPTHRSAAP